MEPLIEELAKSFEFNKTFRYMHPYELYSKWLDATWAFLNAVEDEKVFRETLDKHTYEEGAELGRLFGIYAQAVEAFPFRDILGQLFMRLDVKSAAAGQYFSPQSIAEMMARMQFSRESFEALVREKGEVTVMDPAVGSGVMLLAFADVVNQELGRAGVNKLRLYGMDIDRRCVLMCRIQLRMNGLDSFGRMTGMLARMNEAIKIMDSTAAEEHTTPAVVFEDNMQDVLHKNQLVLF